MPMTPSGMSAAIKTEIKATSQVTNDAELQKFCDAVAKAVVGYIQANGAVAPGIPVATAGSPTAQTGATTGPGSIL